MPEIVYLEHTWCRLLNSIFVSPSGVSETPYLESGRYRNVQSGVNIHSRISQNDTSAKELGIWFPTEKINMLSSSGLTNYG